MKTRAAIPFIMLVSVLVLSGTVTLAQINYAPTEENLRTLADDDGHVAAVRHLLTRGVSPNAPDWRGRTAVHLAAKHGAVQNLTALLEAGGNPNVPDQDGHTPLHVALTEGGRDGRTEIVEVLLARNADPCVRNAEGHIPSHYAVVQEDAPLQQVLDRAGGHDRACVGRPAVASAAQPDAGIWDAVRDPWADEASDPYQDVWGQPASPELDPWGQETVWEQGAEDDEADGLADDPAEDDEADAAYTAALYAALGETPVRETEEDYIGALAALEDQERARQRAEAEARRQAELARQRAEAETRRQAELARQRAEAETRRQAEEARQRAEAETRRQTELAERERLAAFERERQEQEDWEQTIEALREEEEQGREAYERQMREQNNRMWQDMATNQLSQTLAMLQAMREREQAEKSRQRREAERHAEQYQQAVERQQAEHQREVERQRQAAERQRQEMERQQREMQAKREANSASAAQCVELRWSKRTILNKQGKLDFDKGHLEIKNACTRKIQATGRCRDGSSPKKDYPYEGTYYFVGSDFGAIHLEPGVWRIHPQGESCNDRGYRMSHIACTEPYTPYYTARNGSSYRCFE